MWGQPPSAVRRAQLDSLIAGDLRRRVPYFSRPLREACLEQTRKISALAPHKPAHDFSGRTAEACPGNNPIHNIFRALTVQGM